MDEYKYMAIAEWAKKYITDNHLAVGDRFLSEIEISAIHNVSRQTVRQALSILENQNVITRVRGSGTFVKSSTNAVKPPHMSVGIVSTYFSDYIFPSIITGIESVLKKNNISMQLAITHNQSFEEARALNDMMANGVQGMIVEPSKSALPNPNVELYGQIKDNHIPLVFFNAKYSWSDFPCVAMNDVAAGKKATDYLFRLGHKKVFGIFALDDVQGHKRYQGFMESCMKNGIFDAEKNVFWYSTAEKSSLFILYEQRLLALLDTASAVVCYNDKLAVELMNFAKAHGISLPNNVSVIGIDDAQVATICDIPLTTLRHPHQKLGEAAAEKLIAMMNAPKAVYGDTLFVPELVIRDSVIPLK